MNVSFITLGCKVNQAETRNLKKAFAAAGYNILSNYSKQKPDIAVVNTCMVTHVAERKSRNYIRRILKENSLARIYVCGCYAELRAAELMKAIPEIYRVIPNQEKLNITAWGIRPIKKKEPVPYLSKRVRESLKIEDGCDRFCNYCVIPYARGKVVSMPYKEVLKEAAALVAEGVVELILTGINLGRYTAGKKKLPELLTELSKLPKLKRIRLSSIEPDLVNEQLIAAMVINPKVCHHLHIPLQSGSDKILYAMGRPYRTQNYENLIKNIRKKIPDIAITTDIIVGYPVETKETFKETLAFAKKIGFADIHFFKYSPRQEAASFKLKPTLTDQETEVLMQQALLLKETLQKSFLKKLIGKKVEVLVHDRKPGYLNALTSNYAPVIMPDNEAVKLGDILTVKIKRTSGTSLFA